MAMWLCPWSVETTTWGQGLLQLAHGGLEGVLLAVAAAQQQSGREQLAECREIAAEGVHGLQLAGPARDQTAHVRPSFGGARGGYYRWGQTNEPLHADGQRKVQISRGKGLLEGNQIRPRQSACRWGRAAHRPPAAARVRAWPRRVRKRLRRNGSPGKHRGPRSRQRRPRPRTRSGWNMRQ